MTIDYIVASLPTLVFDQPPAISWAKFVSLCADAGKGVDELTGEKWADLETQLKNAVAQMGQTQIGDGVNGLNVHIHGKKVFHS